MPSVLALWGGVTAPCQSFDRAAAYPLVPTRRVVPDLNSNPIAPSLSTDAELINRKIMTSEPSRLWSTLKTLVTPIRPQQLGLSLAGSLLSLGFITAANATEVLFQHRDSSGTTSATVPLSDVETFAETGEASAAIEDYFDSIAVDLDNTQRVLNSTVFDGSVPIGREAAEFLSIQFSRSIGDPLGRERREDMFTALATSFRDDRAISIMEIISNYPDDTVRVNVNRLEQLQSDLTLFVERIEPVIAIVQELLPDLVCDCGFEDEVTGEPSGARLLVRAAETASPEACDQVRAQLASLQTELETHYPDMVASPELIASASGGAVLADGNAGWKWNESTPLGTNAIASLNPTALAMGAETGDPVITGEGELVANAIAESVIITFGPLRPSFKIADLEAFAETGVVPSGWRFYFNVAGIDSEEFRTALTQEAEVNVLFIDGLLNNFLGEYILFEAGQVIRTRSNDSNIQALRSALVLSAANDNQISLLEFLQNYPSSEVIVNGLNLARFGRNLSNQGAVGTATAGLGDLLLEMQGDVADDICDCDAES